MLGKRRTLPPWQRIELVELVEQGFTRRQAAAWRRVSPATVQTWVARKRSASETERADGSWALDRSSRPHRSPRLTSQAEHDRVAGVRERTGWGPRLIAGELAMAHATVSRCLERRGLSRVAREAREPACRYEWPCPGDLLHMDVKRFQRFTRPEGYRRLLGWLADHEAGQALIGVESPGSYGRVLVAALSAAGHEVVACPGQAHAPRAPSPGARQDPIRATRCRRHPVHAPVARGRTDRLRARPGGAPAARGGDRRPRRRAAQRRGPARPRCAAATLGRSPDAEEWPQADVDFHARLAEATHNLLFPVLLGSMAQILMELRLTAAKLPGTPRGAQVPHEAIYEAVREQSQADARRAMREHMAEAEATLQRARLAGAISTLSSAAARRERRVSPARSSTLGPRIGPRLSAPTKRTLRTIQARGLTPGALRRCPVL
jgi:transposase